VEKRDNSRSGFPAITSPSTYLPQQLQQLGDVGGDAPGLDACQPMHTAIRRSGLVLGF
jgi:hypothetical protein